MATYYNPDSNVPNDVVFQIAASRVQLIDSSGVITDLPTAAVTWSTLSGKPAVIASGATVAAARSSISAAASGANGDITSFTALALSTGSFTGGADKVTLHVGGTLVTVTMSQLIAFLQAAGILTNTKPQIAALTSSSTAADIVAALKA